MPVRHPVFYFIHQYCNVLQTPVIKRRQLGASEKFLVRFSTARIARSLMRSIFLLSGDLQIFHTK